MDSELRVLVERFESNPFLARRKLRELLDANPREFRAAAVPLLKEAEAAAAGSGRRFLVTFLAQNDLLMDALAANQGLALGEALSVARTAVKVEPALLNRLAGWVEGPNVPTPVRERLLEIIAGVADPGRLMPLLFQISRAAEPRIRSKVALLIGKNNKNADWLRERLSEPDPRVRANAVEALWGLDFDACVAVFRQAAEDSTPRVAGNAAYGLYLAKDTSSIRILLEMAARPEAGWKATAAWVMGQTQDARFLSVLEPMLRDEGTGVRQNSLKARVRIQKQANRLREAGTIVVQPTLVDVAPSGQRRVSLVLRHDRNSEFDIGLLDAMAFSVREDGVLVSEYEVERMPPPGPMCVGIAVSEEWRRSCRDGLVALAPEKEPGDALALMRFSETATGDPKPAEAAPSAAVSFHSEPDKATQALQLAGQGSVAGMLETLRVLVQAMSAASSKRCLVIAGPTDMPEEPAAGVEALIAAARAANVHVYAVAPDSAARLGAFCQQTGGAFFECARADEVPARLAQLMQHLHHQLAIRYACGPMPGTVTVDVASEHGVGQGSLAITASPKSETTRQSDRPPE